jgi:hypothetical protein
VQSRNEFDPRSTQERIVVEVSDNGIGFEPEAAGRILTPFSQASEAITREFGGLARSWLSNRKSNYRSGTTALCAPSAPVRGRERPL